MLLEVLSDTAKERAWVAANRIDVGSVSYTLRGKMLFAVALLSSGATCVLFQSVRNDCMFGDDISAAIGG